MTDAPNPTPDIDHRQPAESDLFHVRDRRRALYQQAKGPGMMSTRDALRFADDEIDRLMGNGALPKLPVLPCGCVDGQPHGSVLTCRYGLR